MRLNDERRKDLKIGDIIIFTNRDTKEKLKAKVLKLDYYDSFKELYKHFDNIEIGYKKRRYTKSKWYGYLLYKRTTRKIWCYSHKNRIIIDK